MVFGSRGVLRSLRDAKIAWEEVLQQNLQKYREEIRVGQGWYPKI